MKNLKKIFARLLITSVILMAIPLQTVMADGPSVTTGWSTRLSSTSASISGTTTGGVFTDRGIAYATDNVFSDETLVPTAPDGPDEFSVTVDSLTCDTMYYYRTYGTSGTVLLSDYGGFSVDCDDPVIAVVTVTVQDDDIYEEGDDNNVLFTFARAQGDSITASLWVDYSITGTATNNEDYCLLENGRIEIPADDDDIEMAFSAVCSVDGVEEGDETIIITVLPDSDGSEYDVGNPSSVTVTMHDGANPDDPVDELPALTDAWVLDSDGSTTVYTLFESSMVGQLPEVGAEAAVSIEGREGTASTAVLQSESIKYKRKTYTDRVVITTFAEPVVLGSVVVVGDNTAEVDSNVQYEGSVVLSPVVETGDDYVAITDEAFTILPSGDSDIGEVSFGYGVTVTANASWDGTIAVSAGATEDPSNFGLSDAKTIEITKGDYDASMQLSDAALVYFIYEGFSDFENPTVLIDNTNTSVERCSGSEWTGTSISDVSEYLNLEAGDACYIMADDVNDEDDDFVLIATMHFSDFIVGDGEVEDDGGGGGGIRKDIIIEEDDEIIDVIAEITEQVVQIAKDVKAKHEIELTEAENIAEVKSDVIDLFVLSEEGAEDVEEIFESVEDEIFAGSVDADGDGVSNADEIKNGTNPLINEKGTISEIFSKDSDSSIGRLKVAVVSPDGFTLSGTTKANIEVTVKVGENTFKTVSDENGHYLVPVEFLNVDEVAVVETVIEGEVSKVLIKTQKETSLTPEIELEGKNVSLFKDFTAEDLIVYSEGLEDGWIKNANMIVLKVMSDSEYKDEVIASIGLENKGRNTHAILNGTVAPGSTVVLAYKSVIYSSVVIADKNGKFTAELPKNLIDELNANKDLTEIEHQVVVFSVDYKTNKVSPFVKDLFKMYK